MSLTYRPPRKNEKSVAVLEHPTWWLAFFLLTAPTLRAEQTPVEDFDWGTTEMRETGPSKPTSFLGSSKSEDPRLKIEVKRFSVEVVRMSKSQRVYLLKAAGKDELPVRKIILLRTDQAGSGSENVMAFRNLKNYPDGERFAARSVRKYEKWPTLEAGQNFTAINKLGEHLAPLPSPEEQVQDEQDVQELEFDEGFDDSLTSQATPLPPPTAAPAPAPQNKMQKAEPEVATKDNDLQESDPDFGAEDGDFQDETPPAEAAEATPPTIAAYDADLDAGTSPPPGSDAASGNTTQRLEMANLVAEEYHPIEVDRHWLSLGYGYFPTTTPSDTVAYFSGVGLRYGLNLGEHLFIKGKGIQDSFTAELSMFLYSVSGFASDLDSYSVLPLTLAARYNVYFGDSIIAFAYAGISNSMVLSNTDGTDEALLLLEGLKPALGAGLFFHIGPKWYLRADLGLDFIGTGLVLRL